MPPRRRTNIHSPIQTSQVKEELPLELYESIALWGPEMLMASATTWKSSGGIAYRLLLLHQWRAPLQNQLALLRMLVVAKERVPFAHNLRFRSAAYTIAFGATFDTAAGDERSRIIKALLVHHRLLPSFSQLIQLTQSCYQNLNGLVRALPHVEELGTESKEQMLYVLAALLRSWIVYVGEYVKNDTMMKGHLDQFIQFMIAPIRRDLTTNLKDKAYDREVMHVTEADVFAAVSILCCARTFNEPDLEKLKSLVLRFDNHQVKNMLSQSKYDARLEHTPVNSRTSYVDFNSVISAVKRARRTVQKLVALRTYHRARLLLRFETCDIYRILINAFRRNDMVVLNELVSNWGVTLQEVRNSNNKLLRECAKLTNGVYAITFLKKTFGLCKHDVCDEDNEIFRRATGLLNPDHVDKHILRTLRDNWGMTLKDVEPYWRQVTNRAMISLMSWPP